MWNFGVPQRVYRPKPALQTDLAHPDWSSGDSKKSRRVRRHLVFITQTPEHSPGWAAIMMSGVDEFSINLDSGYDNEIEHQVFIRSDTVQSVGHRIQFDGRRV